MRKKNASSVVFAGMLVAGVAFVMFEDKSTRTSATLCPSNKPKADAAEGSGQPWPYLRDGAQAALATGEMLRANYYVVADGSGSMSDSACSGGRSKMEVAKQALSQFASAVPAGANLGLAAFDRSGTRELVSLGAGNREQFARRADAIVAHGGTPLQSAIRLAYDRLTEQARAQLGYGEYHLVVVTDGEASMCQDPTETVNEVLAESPIVVHTIGFCIDKNHSLNQPGRTRYQAANDFESLSKGLAGVLAEAPAFSASTFR